MPHRERNAEERLLFHYEVDTAILLPADRIVLKTQRPVFSVTSDIDLELIDAQRFEVPLHGQGSSFPQHQIVFGGPDFVATAFQQHLGHPVVFQALGIGLDRRERIVPQDVLVKIKQHIGERNVLLPGRIPRGHLHRP